MIQFWMERHRMFRHLTLVLRQDARKFADAGMEFEHYAQRLSHYGGTLLNQLHGHHQIEDAHYFPQLIRLDQRLERGFDLLESDHTAMDGVLHGLATGANEVLQNGGEVGAFLDQLDQFEALLERHLTDEEDIVVPVVLHTGFSG
jgi:hemerythrin-like domain-containing protein